MCGHEILPNNQVFEWLKKLKEGRETTEDDDHSGRTCTFKNGRKHKRNSQLIRENRRMTIHAVTHLTVIDKHVRQISSEAFNTKKPGSFNRTIRHPISLCQ